MFYPSTPCGKRHPHCFVLLFIHIISALHYPLSSINQVVHPREHKGLLSGTQVFVRLSTDCTPEYKRQLTVQIWCEYYAKRVRGSRFIVSVTFAHSGENLYFVHLFSSMHIKISTGLLLDINQRQQSTLLLSGNIHIVCFFFRLFFKWKYNRLFAPGMGHLPAHTVLHVLGWSAISVYKQVCRIQYILTPS